MKGIADTGFIVAFLNRNDTHHRWAKSIALRISPPLPVCEAVLAEAVWHVRAVVPVTAWLKSGLLRLDFDAAAHLDEIERLAERFQNLEPDFADLCVVRMSELHRQHVVVTTDIRDFKIYRRFRNQPIPLLTPSGRGEE